MIKEFAGRKFRTRDGKYDADIVARRVGYAPFCFWVILTPITEVITFYNLDRPLTYTKDLHVSCSEDETDIDLIEVKKYDWPLWAVVKVWDGDETANAVWAHPFAVTNRNGYPMTFNYYSNKKGMWVKMAWKHAELIDIEKEGVE